MLTTPLQVSAIDLFCGAGGLSFGLRDAGIKISAGFDVDPRCQYPFMANICSPFIEQDVRSITPDQLASVWDHQQIRLLAGCAPCQPFSSYRRGADTSKDENWSLLESFGSLVIDTLPELVTMENVTRIQHHAVFGSFVALLLKHDYFVSYKSCYGPRFGLPQSRRRLVLLASRFGPINVPTGNWEPGEYVTVRKAIGKLPSLRNGEADSGDRLHTCRLLEPINLRRMQASRPGGTWHDWPAELRAPCHVRSSGASFRSVYARMEWDKPAPTITTQAHNFGTGRFGHPEQERAISLREAAILQGFPEDYRFVRPEDPVEFTPLGRLIGNAVPPPMGTAIGSAIIQHLAVIRDKSQLHRESGSCQVAVS